MENKLQFKWGNELFDDGITNIPQCVARFGRQFMSASEFSFVICVFTYQYGQDSPYPSQKTIADNMGVGTRQIRKWITSLEEKDLIEISFRYSDSGKRTSNEYSFKKLTDKCLKHSNDLKTKKEEPEKIKKYKKKKRHEKTNGLHMAGRNTTGQQGSGSEYKEGPVVSDQKGPMNQELESRTLLNKKNNNIRTLAHGNDCYKKLANYLLENGFTNHRIIEILKKLADANMLNFNMRDVERQLKDIVGLSEVGYTFKGGGFSTYFVNGLKDLTEQRMANQSIRERQAQDQEMKRQQQGTSLYYNWLEDDSIE